MLSLSDYSTRNVEDSGSRREAAHGGSNGGPISGVNSIGSGIEVSASAIVQTGREESVSSTQRISGNDGSGNSKSVSG